MQPRGTSRCAGFTLLEVLVALAVFSLAALAMLRLTGASIATAAHLDEKLIARITAQNLAIEAELAQPAPAYGSRSGTLTNARHRLGWTQTTSRTPDPALQSITIRITSAAGTTLATQSLIRPAP